MDSVMNSLNNEIPLKNLGIDIHWVFEIRNKPGKYVTTIQRHTAACIFIFSI